VELLRRLIVAAKLARDLPFETNLWKPQNVCFDISRTIFPECSKRARQGTKRRSDGSHESPAASEPGILLTPPTVTLPPDSVVLLRLPASA
jgi:hypothetical protein